jgi:ubiquinone/menaquinone biosynthesis C-methylase UbiE
MGFYEQRVLPRIIDLACGSAEIEPYRRRITAGISGEVVELGFGSGLNIPHYPSGTTCVHAVDPSTLGQQLASERLAASETPVDFAGLDGQQLPFSDDSADAVLSTFTLCTIPDADAALAEVRRVLKPGGTLHFVEHGRSPDIRVTRWQDRWNPFQQVLFGGCNVNRPIAAMIERAGLRIESLDNSHLGGPKFLNYIYEGIAIAP